MPEKIGLRTDLSFVLSQENDVTLSRLLMAFRRDDVLYCFDKQVDIRFETYCFMVFNPILMFVQ